MIGAYIGDIVGSVYEWNNTKDEHFEPLFGRGSRYTDDSVLTAAIAAGLNQIFMLELVDDQEIVDVFGNQLRTYAQYFRGCGYGKRFTNWAYDPDAKAYSSRGNGSAMRVSPVGWYAKTIVECEHLAKLSALPTHNHPDGIAGAQATAGAIFIATDGGSKEDIREYVERYYPLSKSYAEIQPDYKWVSFCDGTVQPAVLAFLASENFEDAIRKAVALGGDSDTIAAITGSIAEAYYGRPFELWKQARPRLISGMKTPMLTESIKRIYELHEIRRDARMNTEDNI